MLERLKKWLVAQSTPSNGELEVEVIDLGSGFKRLISRGLDRDELRNLELAEVPDDLTEVGVDLIRRFAPLIEREKISRDGESVGGPLIDPSQPAVQMATLRIAARSIEPGAEELFRLVDYGEPVDSTLAHRLLATHLAILASRERNPKFRLVMFRRSVELFPGHPAADSGRVAFDRGENLNNYLGWEGLGETLMELGHVEQGWNALGQAVVRCPAWAAEFAEHVRETVGAADPRAIGDPRVRFWLEVKPSDQTDDVVN